MTHAVGGGDPSSGGAGGSRRVAVDTLMVVAMWWSTLMVVAMWWSTLMVVVVILVDAGGGVVAQVKYVDKMVPRWC